MFLCWTGGGHPIESANIHFEQSENLDIVKAHKFCDSQDRKEHLHFRFSIWYLVIRDAEHGLTSMLFWDLGKASLHDVSVQRCEAERRVL